MRNRHYFQDKVGQELVHELLVGCEVRISNAEQDDTRWNEATVFTVLTVLHATYTRNLNAAWNGIRGDETTVHHET